MQRAQSTSRRPEDQLHPADARVRRRTSFSYCQRPLTFVLASTPARSLYENSIGAEGAKHISEALKTNSTLQTLDLRGNRLDAEAAKHLSEGLKANTALTSLDLYWNSLGDEGARHISEGLRANKALTSLNGSSVCSTQPDVPRRRREWPCG